MAAGRYPGVHAVARRERGGYSLQVRSVGQPPLQSVEMLAGSGHQSSTQQFARRIVTP
jgi:hypothetical protein